MTPILDPVQLAARTLREAVRDKSYRAYPIGQEVGAYLRWKRAHITPVTYRSYESHLDKLARAFPDLELVDFEPPMGTERLEEFFDTMWGGAKPGTYNTNLAICSDFFKWAVLKGKLHGDPTLPMRRRKKGSIYRTTFSEGSIQRIIDFGPATTGPDAIYEERDRLCLRLLLQYGIRKGALQNVQFEHFNFARRRLTIFSKGEKVRDLPIPSDTFWRELDAHMRTIDAQPHWYLLHSRKNVFWKYSETGEKLWRWFSYHDKRFSSRGIHEWWYGCLRNAGVAHEGQTAGERMHKARHTAGQRVLDQTGNIKAVQKLLGHASAKTTMDTYVDWDEEQLADTLREVLGDE